MRKVLKAGREWSTLKTKLYELHQSKKIKWKFNEDFDQGWSYLYIAIHNAFFFIIYWRKTILNSKTTRKSLWHLAWEDLQLNIKWSSLLKNKTHHIHLVLKHGHLLIFNTFAHKWSQEQTISVKHAVFCSFLFTSAFFYYVSFFWERDSTSIIAICNVDIANLRAFIVPKKDNDPRTPYSRSFFSNIKS